MKMFLRLTLAGTLAAWPMAVLADTLRIAMTTSDVPTTGGIPDNGSEGGRFAGYPIYDALVNWDFTDTSGPAGLTPGLATSWSVDPDDQTKWVFKLREGVLFHDGSTLTADDIVWNLDRHLNEAAPHYDKVQAPTYRTYTGNIAKYEKIDDLTVAIYTKEPFSMLDYLISRVFIVSPTQYEKVGNWLDFQMTPAGTGPFKVVAVTPRTSIELERFADYWDASRVPKVEKLILLPIPDSNTRTAALRSGQVDWIEVPAPDSIPSLVAAGFNIVTKPYPHIWSWRMNTTEASPLHDVRVRRALNYAIDRDAMVELLNGTAIPAIGIYPQNDPYFGAPEHIYTYNPDLARSMLAEAGYGPSNPLKLVVNLPTAGSGNMVPLAMSELVQLYLAEVGVTVEYEVADWGVVLKNMRTAPGTEGQPHRDAINHGQPFGDPTNLYRSHESRQMPPSGGNWGLHTNADVDKYLNELITIFDPAEQTAVIAKAHQAIVDDAARLFVVHDLNPRALGPKVIGFDQAQSWYQDFTQVSIAD
jgi:peptide/nickel transport system substrate-binding protein